MTRWVQSIAFTILAIVVGVNAWSTHRAHDKANKLRARILILGCQHRIATDLSGSKPVRVVTNATWQQYQTCIKRISR